MRSPNFKKTTHRLVDVEVAQVGIDGGTQRVGMVSNKRSSLPGIVLSLLGWLSAVALEPGRSRKIASPGRRRSRRRRMTSTTDQRPPLSKTELGPARAPSSS